MKQIIKAHSGGPTVIGGDAIEFFINDEPAFELLDGLADGGNLYDWTQCSAVVAITMAIRMWDRGLFAQKRR